MFPLEFRLIAIAVAVAGALLFARHLVSEHDAGVKQAVNDLYAAQAVKAEAASRAEEQRRAQVQTEALNEAKRQADAARADADSANRAAERLRKRANVAFSSPGSADPAASASGSAASNPASVYADVLGRLGDAAGQLAAIADERGIAGNACERSYDALKP